MRLPFTPGSAKLLPPTIDSQNSVAQVNLMSKASAIQTLRGTIIPRVEILFFLQYDAKMKDGSVNMRYREIRDAKGVEIVSFID